MRDNAQMLSDFRVPTLSIECEPCGRAGRYNVARLMEQYGDAKLPELLYQIADCPKAHAHSIYKAVYGKVSHGPHGIRPVTHGAERRLMMVHTSRITDLLRKKPGRYIHHDAGNFRMKEANGEDVKLTEDRREYLVEPAAQQTDDLMDAKRLVRDGSKYVLPPSRERRPRA